jgi:mannitol-1-phosphate/altronate dehydrogenase
LRTAGSHCFLTITEKGYCIDPATGKLDLTQPRIAHDLQEPGEPHSAPGILVEALARRRERGLPAFTVLSCDNIPDNGHIVKNAVLGMAQTRSSELAQWIDTHVSFLNHGGPYRAGRYRRITGGNCR